MRIMRYHRHLEFSMEVLQMDHTVQCEDGSEENSNSSIQRFSVSRCKEARDDACSCEDDLASFT